MTESLFKQAKANTELCLRNFEDFKTGVIKEANSHLQQAIFSATVEIKFAQLENVPEEEWSELARKINQDSSFIKEIKSIMIETPLDDKKEKNEDKGVNLDKSENKIVDDSTEIIIEQKKEKSAGRRWKLAYAYDLIDGENPCRLKIEVLSSTQKTSENISNNIENEQIK